MPTVRQLEYFVAVAEEGSFTRAAERLMVSQPGLSHQFRALETEVGAQLIERLPRGARLTPAGRAALPHARSALAHSRWAAEAAKRSGDEATGVLEIATVYSLSIGLLPPHLADLSARFPRLGIRLFEHRHTDELRAAMEAGEADIAVGPTPANWDGPLYPLAPEEFVIVGRVNGIAGERGSIALATAMDERWVGFTSNSGLGEMFDAAMHRAGVEPDIALRTEQAVSAIAYAREGIGLTIVPRNIVAQHADIGMARIDPPLVRDLAAYSRSSVDPVMLHLIASLTGGLA